MKRIKYEFFKPAKVKDKINKNLNVEIKFYDNFLQRSF